MVRSGHRVDVELELQSRHRSNQVNFHLSIIRCTDLTQLQVDAKIEVAGENEKEQDSKEAETEVSKSQIHDVSFFLGALYPSNILPIILLSGLIFPVKNSCMQSSKTAAGVVQSKMQRIL